VSNKKALCVIGEEEDITNIGFFLDQVNIKEAQMLALIMVSDTSEFLQMTEDVDVWIRECKASGYILTMEDFTHFINTTGFDNSTMRVRFEFVEGVWNE
jgi:hypothetical protein